MLAGQPAGCAHAETSRALTVRSRDEARRMSITLRQRQQHLTDTVALVATLHRGNWRVTDKHDGSGDSELTLLARFPSPSETKQINKAFTLRPCLDNMTIVLFCFLPIYSNFQNSYFLSEPLKKIIATAVHMPGLVWCCEFKR